MRGGLVLRFTLERTSSSLKTVNDCLAAQTVTDSVWPDRYRRCDPPALWGHGPLMKWKMDFSKARPEIVVVSPVKG